MSSPATILVVDDDPANVSLYVDILSTEGRYDIETAANGQQALTRARTRPFDLIISDLTMPELDGVSLLKEVKRLNPNVEVIIVTGAGSTDSAVDAFRSNVFDYLQKPVDIESLLSTVHRAIEKSSIRSTIASLRASFTGGGNRQGETLLGHVCVDNQFKIIDIDPRCLLLLGIPEENWRGRRVRELPLLSFLEDGFAATLAGGPPPTRRTMVLGLQDKLRTMTYSMAGVSPATPDGLLVAMIVEDTHWRKADKERRARERLTAISQMAKAVEEQLSVYLTAIGSSTEMIMRHVGTLSGLRPNLTVIMERCDVHCKAVNDSIHRLRSLTSTFWDFARQYVPDLEQVNLNKIVSDLIEGPALRAHRGRIELTLDPNPIPLEANQRDLRLLMGHLVSNALTATEKGGRVVISTSARDDMAILEVADDGAGIPAENLEKIFEPFFTTWGGETHKGLGLAVSMKVVDDHEGVMCLETYPSIGTSFIVYLPQKRGT